MINKKNIILNNNINILLIIIKYYRFNYIIYYIKFITLKLDCFYQYLKNQIICVCIHL